MPTLERVKFEKLMYQTEREGIFNMMLKGEIVKWSDVVAVYSEKIVSARNILLGIPYQLADELTREQVERVRKTIHEALERVSNICLEDVGTKSKMGKFFKADKGSK